MKPPVLTHQVEPKYPYPHGLFHKAKSGDVKLHLIVDEQGLPQDVTVAEGWDEKADQCALDAVRQYRFQSATRDGQPVRVEIYIQVHFRVY